MVRCFVVDDMNLCVDAAARDKVETEALSTLCWQSSARKSDADGEENCGGFRGPSPWTDGEWF
jgi:hypothetical protein